MITAYNCVLTIRLPIKRQHGRDDSSYRWLYLISTDNGTVNIYYTFINNDNSKYELFIQAVNR